ncbi:hypothetical protein N665_0478s0044 [Sinapis alba]|nr:hypothetical protein N665_0478s0044 [Sinapis alba]
MGFGAIRSIFRPLSRTLQSAQRRSTSRCGKGQARHFGLNMRKKPPSSKGPYAYVQYTPGEPIASNNPNKGSVKRRNAKKRIGQRRAFILSEKKKRQGLVQEAKRKKRIKEVERKMAKVARERAWDERLAELQRLEEEKKKSMSS